MRITESLRHVDAVTDLSETICEERIPIEFGMHCLGMLGSLTDKIIHSLHFGFRYWMYFVDGDPKNFYLSLEGLPYEEKPDFLKKLTPNEMWDEAVKRHGFRRVGVLTQDARHLSEEYLRTQEERFRRLGAEIVLLGANEPEIKEGRFTGQAKYYVTPQRLISLLDNGSYIPIIGDGTLGEIITNNSRLRRRFIQV